VYNGKFISGVATAEEMDVAPRFAPHEGEDEEEDQQEVQHLVVWKR
jgi:hypothetical protein